MSDRIIDDAWFRDARFGMFIHWGLYAVPGGIWQGKETEYIGEWLQAKFRIPKAEYEKLAAQFNPVGFDAEEWARIAADAGMKYLVFTAKHHEGFAMYHSHCDRFNIVDATPFGRDVLAELAAACRKYGLKLGLYYSQFLDWHDPDGGDPGPDAPKNFGMSWGNDWDFPDGSTKDFSRYFEGKVIPQLTELLSNYGPIAVMWFDCPMSITRDSCGRLVELVRRFQPECLINTRIGHGFGDYGSFGDNLQPSARRDNACETPGTLNDTWGFKFNDQNWKAPRDVVLNLAGLAEKNTNYLLNIGPGPDGRFPAAAINILGEVGNWMRTYGQAIHCSNGNPFPYDLPWGKITVSPGSRDRKTRINLILTDFPRKKISFQGLKESILRCYDPARPDVDLPFTCSPTGIAGLEEVVIETKNVTPSLLPMVVLELDTEQPPRIEQQLLPQEGTLRLPASAGRISHGNELTGGNQNGISVAGEHFSGAGHSRLDAGGRLMYWDNPSDAIEWQALFPEPARYKVEVVMMVRQHSAEWYDGQKLRFRFEQNDGIHEWETVLKGKPFAASAGVCYISGLAEAGTLEVKHPGNGKLALAMIDPGNDGGKTMNLQEIRLTRIQDMPE